MSFSVKDKVALVTGANRGIGKAIVESFFEHGVRKIYLAVRNPESTQELQVQYGDKVVVLRADVTDTGSLQSLAEQATDVDILVNNAGVMNLASPLSDDVEASLQHELDVNVFGLLRTARAFAKILETNQGALVQLNSIASIKTFGYMTTYCASKAASYSVTQGLREKLGEKGVKVLSVHPGPIATEMGDNAGFSGAPNASVVSEGIVDALEAGDFHLFPDSTAKHLEEAYRSYAEQIILGDLSV